MADFENMLVGRELLEALVDGSDCHLDHHGSCQAHGYLSLEPGQLCPQQELKLLLGFDGSGVPADVGGSGLGDSEEGSDATQ